MKNKQFDPALWDTEIQINRFNERIFPLSKGSKIQEFEFEKFSFKNRVEKKIESFTQFCKSNIKVVSFLTPGWNLYSESHLERLNKCYSEIVSLGAELCLFVKGSSEEIESFIGERNLPFWAGSDNDFRIAKLFGVFHENHQPWHRISGITEDGPFPSIFVINRKSEVLYSSVDISFDKPFSFLEVAASVYTEKQQHVWNSFEINRKVIYS
jgi:peroxiredoxin